MSGIALLIGGVAIVLVALRWSQASATNEHRMALIATLGVLAAVYNVVIPVPNVEATTLVVVASALVLGGPFAASVGVVAIIGTSSVSSVGVWTLWQIVATCAIAVVAGIVGGVMRGTARGSSDALVWRSWAARAVALVLVAGSTIVYDVFTTWTSLATFGGVHQRFDTALLAGVPFYVVHLVASTTLAALVAVSLLEALERVRPRLDGGRIVS